MRTIKFAPYNELITEQHNIENATVKDNYYQPLNLNIFVTHACQCNCHFCIDKNNKNIGNTIYTDELYYKGLRESLELLKEKEIEVEFTLTGGEPTINPIRFVETLKILKEYGIKERTISTNGLNLLIKHEGKPLIQYLVDFGFTHNVSISRMSIEEDLHDKIMGGPTISNEHLKKIALFSKYNDIELRVSMNVLKDSVCNLGNMMRAVNVFSDMGINTVLFRELQGVKDSLKLTKASIDITRMKDYFIYQKTLKGIFYFVDIYLYEANGRKYIVKYYYDNPANNNIIGSMSYTTGVLKEGFNGKEIKRFY